MSVPARSSGFWSVTQHPIEDLATYLEDYYPQMLQEMEPTLPGQNKERRRRLMRGTERHTYKIVIAALFNLKNNSKAKFICLFTSAIAHK